MKYKINYWAILTFYSIAIILRYLTNKTEILNPISNDLLKGLLQGIGPAVGAMVAIIIFKIKPTLTLQGNYQNPILPFLLYWAFPIFLILSVEYFTKGTFSLMTVVVILIYGLLEEIGWRGFLQPQLKPLPAYASIFIVATFWFVWHLNFEISLSNLLFYGILILGTWGIGKVADRTSSLLAVSGFHSLNNFFADMSTTKILMLLILLSVWIFSLMKRSRRLSSEIWKKE